nr:6554_t:CDS:2 [Entrophospora candida]
MAGHSHSANIKYRKDRQDSARSQLFLKLRKKIENIIREKGAVNEKALNLARENKFPKEKVYQIWEKFRADREGEHELFSSDKEVIHIVKNIVKENRKIVVIEEKSFWKTLLPCQLVSKEEIDYYQELKKQLSSSNFYTNVEK